MDLVLKRERTEKRHLGVSNNAVKTKLSHGFDCVTDPRRETRAHSERRLRHRWILNQVDFPLERARH